jgi:hypothetical protein
MPGAANLAKASTLRQDGLHQFWLGVALIAVGIVATVLTYALAPPGGVYIVALGPIAFGLRSLIRGLIALSRARRP